ncbi:ABC transporter substrate-binding protein [Promicromonospora iranensis]|uniref:Multiple sugar transport system substrate-binding protein n=1 Tax=Promicromonospora iranensis TaxID=1105144 RepID=A0ABU2CW51_9MICO|nr:sugar ABC transporter substrate-binding protein [Promicromonospora iranensis]MDR7385528.1 multiple sugar transport system substrate-binding protein [Promicromonospora iranensis]
MNRTRTGLTASLATVGLLALTACTPGGAAADGTVRLQMVESLTNPARTEVVRELLDEFEAQNPGVTVDLVSPPTDQADQKLQQMLQSGRGVDVLEVRDSTVGAFSNNGWLYDLSDDVTGWAGWEDLTDNAQAVTEADGSRYFVPYGFYGLSLFYRTDLVEEAGFDGPPKSWEDLLEQATAIQDPAQNTYGYAFRGGQNGFANVVAAIEAYTIDDLDVEDAYRLEDGSTIFAAPEAQDAVDTYFSLFEQASPPSAVSWGYPEMVEGFTNGSTAFLLQDPEVIATVAQSTTIDESQWSTAPLLTGPTGRAAQPLATAGWGVAEASENKEAAVDLVEFLSGAEPATRFAQENSLVPIIDGAGEDPFYKEGPWSSYVAMTEDPETYVNVVQPRGVSWWTQWEQKADQDLQAVLLGSMTTTELLAEWDTFWTEKYAAEQ